MKRHLLGALGASALLFGAAAFADDQTTGTTPKSDTTMKDKSTYEKSSDTPSMSGDHDQMGSKLQGEVVKFSSNMLYLRHMGAVVPIKVDKTTRFEDRSMVKEGQMVTAELKVVNKTQNLATWVGSETGTGGSGYDSGDSGSGFHDRLKNDELNNSGTGGSGTVDTPAIPSDSMNPPAQPERSPNSPVPEDQGTQQKSQDGKLY
jgi:hypothetical protein